MTIKYGDPAEVPINALRLPEAMQRQPALRRVAQLLETEGDDPTPFIARVPFIILAKPDGEIIDGCSKWLAAKAAGLTTVTVQYIFKG